MEKTMTVDVYAISGDFVTCSDCGKVMLLPHGADKCPACRSEGTLAWTDDALQETDIDGLVGRHCNLHQKVAPAPEEYLSLSTLATEYIHYLADRPQTARETFSLILEISSLFEKHWQETCCFQSENLYTPAINSLLDKLDRKLREGDAIPIEYQNCRSLGEFFRVVADDRPARQEVLFSSDREGNFYFNGRKVTVVPSMDYAYRLRKTRIHTSYNRPADFYSRFLARYGPYGTYGNSYYPSVTDMICRRYLPDATE